MYLLACVCVRFFYCTSLRSEALGHVYVKKFITHDFRDCVGDNFATRGEGLGTEEIRDCQKVFLARGRISILLFPSFAALSRRHLFNSGSDVPLRDRRFEKISSFFFHRFN